VFLGGANNWHQSRGDVQSFREAQRYDGACCPQLQRYRAATIDEDKLPCMVYGHVGIPGGNGALGCDGGSQQGSRQGSACIGHHLAHGVVEGVGQARHEEVSERSVGRSEVDEGWQ
jgi:hypothetical protein